MRWTSQCIYANAIYKEFPYNKLVNFLKIKSVAKYQRLSTKNHVQRYDLQNYSLLLAIYKINGNGNV